MKKTILLYGIIPIFLLIGNIALSQQNLYVNDNSTTGDVFTSAIGSNLNLGTSNSPFATINYAISQAQPGDIVWVDAGTYVENVVVDKSVTLKGAKAGIDPGSSLDRNTETVIRSASNDITNGVVFAVRSTNITIDGFLIDGDNPTIPGGANINGVDVNAGFGVFNQQVLVDGLRLKNNVIKNFNRYGIFLQRIGQPTITENNLVSNNHFDNINNRAVGLFNAYTSVATNNFTRVVNGIFFANATMASTLPINITDNYIEASANNILLGNMSASGPSISITGNTLNPVGAKSNGVGISIGGLITSGSLQLSNNTIANMSDGIVISSITAPGGVNINGGSVTNSSGVGLFLVAENVNLSLSNLTLNSNDVNIDASSIGPNMQLGFSNVSINGGTTGIRFYGNGLLLPANALTGISFSNQSKEYILQTANSFVGQTIDASTAVFDGIAPVNMTLAQLFATEDKLTHRIDFNDVGYFKLKPNEVFVTPNSFAATLHPSFGVATTTPDINRATAAADEGNVIHVAAGTYIGQVFINKGITLQGEGIGATIINPGNAVPATLPGIPPGVVYSASEIADVFIKDVTINSGTPQEAGVQYYGISLQTGGGISGCEINGAGTGSNTGQGIYIQKDDVDPEAISILNNHLHHIGFLSIKINVPHITAIINNNTIDVTGSGFGMGLVAGGEPYLIDGLDFIGNKITGITGFGVKVNCSNSNVTISNNSFEKGSNEFYTSPFIQNTSMNPINASCNWFGSADAEVVRSRIQGYNVGYGPWLSNGTDNNVAFGFQPLEDVCNGRQNKFYVNDNSQTGDVFTTAVGNNSNNGFSSAPFATFEYAYSVAQAGDTIYMDAGNYPMADFVLNKAITVLGPNYLLSPNDANDKRLLNAGRNAEATISGAWFTINSSNISLKGLIFSPGSKSAFSLSNSAGTTNDFRNFQFEKNILKTNAPGSTQLNFTGVFVTSPNMPQTSGYAIIDNRFEKNDAGSGTTVHFSYLKNITVTDNSFVVTGLTPRTQNTLVLGSFGITDSVVFSNNTVDQANTVVNGPRVANAVIANNKFYNTGTSCNFANAIVESSNIEITGNFMETTSGGVPFIGYNKSGGNLAGSSTTLRAENNIMNGISSGLSGQLFGSFNITVNNSVLNPTIILKGNKITYSGDLSMVESGFIRPITLRGKIANATIENNEINLNNSGGAPIPTVPGGALITSPGITINSELGASAYIPSNAVINILNNKIVGFKQSIAFYDGTNGLNPYIGYGNLPAGAVVNINNNSFSGDSISINNGAVGQSVNASCNWHGSASAQDVVNKVINGTVTYRPWLTNGTDNDAATGFQPLPGICNGRQTNFYVNDNSQTGDVFTTAMGSNSNTGLSSAPFATLEYAYSIAQAGDIIYMDAGTYNTSNIILDKSITILGTNYQVSPNSIADPLVYNSSRNTESIISNSQITLAANNINVEGLTFNTPLNNQFVLSSTAVANDLCNNIKLEKNRFISTTSASNVMVLNGKAVSPATTSNFLIQDNRMENANTAYMRIDNFNNFTITRNSFIRTTAPVNAVAIRQNFGRIENLIVEENVFQFWDATVFTGGVAVKNFVYNNNKAYNTLRGVQFNAGPTEPISLTITNNLFQQHPTAGASPSLFISRNSALNAATPNSIHIEANTFTYDGTGQVNIPQALVNIICNNNSTSGDPLSSNFQLTFRKNIINYTGNLSGASNLSPHGLRFEGRLAVANIDNNEITYTGINLPNTPAAEILKSSGIFIANTSVIPPGAVLNINNNKVNGFKQSIAFYNGVVYGGILPGVIANINNNSFTGDLLSINNGTTSQSVNANCNWYGSVAVQVVASKVSNGSVIYSPWLTNGTDNDVATGFQPVPGACAGTPVVVTVNAATNVTCFGANNGAISITISGGIIPYTIAWSKDGNPFSTSEDLTNLSPGIYSVTVTDANGSVASITDITISQPSLLTASASGSNVSCFGGSNGSANATVGGGTLPYSYLWSNGGTNASISNVGAGIYTITVTDGNGCTKSASYQVTQPALLTAVATGTSTACANSAAIVASGGTAPYNYSWNNGAITQNITSLPAGTYTVTVTDDHGCQTTASCTVSSTEAFNPSASVTNVSCFGGNNGSITVTNVNGVAPFQYSINGVDFQGGNTFNLLVAGAYTITVKDVNGCTGFVEKTITQPPLLTLVQNTVQSTCYGQSTGSITVTVGGGSGSVGYSWSGPAGYTSTQKNISGLAGGNYSLTVTDANGCSKNLDVIVPTSNQVNVTPIITNIACKGEVNGSINITVTGGSGIGFSYLWNTGATANSISNLGAGNYSVTITDIGTGCAVVRSFTITQPTSFINLTTTKTNATGCAGLGTITATGSGGTAGYQYKLDNGNYQSSGSFTGLYAGNYTVWIQDVKGCTKSSVVSITDNGSDEYEGNNSKNQAKTINVDADVFARIAVANDAADWFKFTTASSGNYTVALTHPSASFTYNLYTTGNNTPALTPGSTTATSKQYTLAANTTYYISITGGLSYQCYKLSVTSSQLFTRSNQQGQPVKEIQTDLFEIKVLGNPSANHFNIVVSSSSNEKMKMRIIDVSGKVIEQKENLSAEQVIKIGEKYHSGVYFAEIIQGNHRKTVRLVKL